MADDLPKADEHGAIARGDSDDLVMAEGEFGLDIEFDDEGAEQGDVDKDFGVEFEFDTEGIEPGLELDLSGIEPEEPEPEPAPPQRQPEPSVAGPPAHTATGPNPPPRPAPTGPGAPPASQPRPRPQRQPGPPPAASGLAGLSSPLRVALGLGAALLVVIFLAVMMSGDDSEPAATPMQEQVLIEGERAFHQGKWVEALQAFNRLRRYPTSAEAQSVRERGLEEKAFKQIMDATPSAKAVQRLEKLSELYPGRAEVRERLGEVRKALSSGARAAAADDEDQH